MTSDHEFPPRDWQVLLLGGPSGSGKTAISYRLARYFGVGVTEVDDFQVLLERMTTPEQFPALHVWQTHPDPGSLAAEEIVGQLIEVGRVMGPGLEAVIANHLETETPVVLEGDFILPELALTSPPGSLSMVERGRMAAVRAVFLYEEDQVQLVENFLRREPEAGRQEKRARVSWQYGQWLKEEAERLRIPALAARPWETVFERVLTAIENG